MRQLAFFLFIASALAIPSYPTYQFKFFKNDSDKRQLCLATPIKMARMGNKCLVNFFTAGHCGVGEFDYFKADFISGKVPMPKNGFLRHQDYLKSKTPGLDFAKFSLKMNCGQLDQVKLPEFAPLFSSNSLLPEVSLLTGQKVYVKNTDGALLPGKVQLTSEYAFAYNVKIEGDEKDLSPGDSGGPVYNELGQMIGVLSGRKEKGSYYFSSLGVGWVKSKIN